MRVGHGKCVALATGTRDPSGCRLHERAPHPGICCGALSTSSLPAGGKIDRLLRCGRAREQVDPGAGELRVNPSRPKVRSPMFEVSCEPS